MGFWRNPSALEMAKQAQQRRGHSFGLFLLVSSAALTWLVLHILAIIVGLPDDKGERIIVGGAVFLGIWTGQFFAVPRLLPLLPRRFRSRPPA
ncbi:hypothetical protein [Rhizomicrobium electricum]|uniref:Uncharacterized protein n=1 Tax=Rhizomicrobium electricum TaxID=480070 RepID=A0ABN1FC03_9PROT|nr:hypothetical protein [Rhizomicrobium electricum]NIJ50717.1 membrane-anchored glycerophosphoryl diester phosphodiesterase (GDPDase) [Rhizomicrobium electricum]